MKSLKFIMSIALSGVLMAFCGAQTIPGLFRDNAPKARMAIADLPDDYKAVLLKNVSSDSGLGNLFGSPFASLMMLGTMQSSAGSGDASQQRFMKLMDAASISFTRGDTLDLLGGKFLITYKLSMDVSTLQSFGMGNKVPDLELVLVRNDSIQYVTPKPEMTKKSFQDLMSPITPTADPVAAQTKTLSNLKQTATGMMLYLGDDDDFYPYAQDTKSALAVMLPYVKNYEVFKSLNPNSSELRLNMAISGVNASAIPAPAETPMFYESATWPDGRRAVAYCDGHAKMVDDVEWQGLQGALHLKLPRTIKPLPPFYWKTLHFDDSKIAPGSPATAIPPDAAPARVGPPPYRL